MLATFRRFVPSRMIRVWILITLAASVVAASDGGWLARKTAYVPARIWAGEIWRVVTWTFIDRTPIALVTTCLVIARFGGQLVTRWGELGLRRYLMDVVLAATTAAALVAWLSDSAWNLPRHGGWAICDALVIAWARVFPRDTVLLHGFVPLQGRTLIMITAGITAVIAIFVGPFVFAPELITCGLAIYYPASRLRE